MKMTINGIDSAGQSGQKEHNVLTKESYDNLKQAIAKLTEHNRRTIDRGETQADHNATGALLWRNVYNAQHEITNAAEATRIQLRQFLHTHTETIERGEVWNLPQARTMTSRYTNSDGSSFETVTLTSPDRTTSIEVGLLELIEAAIYNSSFAMKDDEPQRQAERIAAFNAKVDQAAIDAAADEGPYGRNK